MAPNGLSHNSLKVQSAILPHVLLKVTFLPLIVSVFGRTVSVSREEKILNSLSRASVVSEDFLLVIKGKK